MSIDEIASRSETAPSPDVVSSAVVVTVIVAACAVPAKSNVAPAATSNSARRPQGLGTRLLLASPASAERATWAILDDPRCPATTKSAPRQPATDAIRAVLVAAGLEAWAGFLGAERIERANRGRTHPADLVAVDGEGVFAFVAWDEATGEIERLYTHPRGQGRGAGGELLSRALDALRAAGRAEAWLKTEERNAGGGRRFYGRQGWVEDGPPRVRDWHGARLVEPRYVKRLGALARDAHEVEPDASRDCQDPGDGGEQVGYE